MSATYNIICIPLDASSPEAHPDSFTVILVADIQFPTRVAQTPDSIRAILSQHPLLSIPKTQPVHALVTDYQSWITNKRIDPSVAIPITLMFDGLVSQADALSNLTAYLSTSTTVTPASLQHDASYEALDENHFVDVNKTADDLRAVKRELLQSSSKKVSSTYRGKSAPLVKTGTDLTALTGRAIKFARWMDVGSHTSVLNAIHEPDGDRREVLFRSFGDHAGTLRDLHGSFEKLRTRAQSSQLTECTVSTTDRLSTVDGQGNKSDASFDDPQVAIHAALKNNLIAESCGFATRWRATAAKSLVGKQCYVIQLDLTSLTQGQGTNIAVQTTAFSRATHTHPISYADIGSAQPSNGLLAALNAPDGSVRYRATSINAEHHLLKETLVQASNSLGGPSNSKEDNFGQFQDPLDDRPPQVFGHGQYGSAEPETSGVIFSAPVEDLLTPSDLRFNSPDNRAAQMPCLFLEDLWVGYRLDLRNSQHPTFSSIHSKTVLVQFPNGSTQLNGEMEDFIEREQRDDTSLGNSSTDLTSYVGLNTGQAAKLRVLLNLPSTAPEGQIRPFKLSVIAFGQSERLLFQESYFYRFRNVFLGGVGVTINDPALVSDAFNGKYIQAFPFFRAKGLCAAEPLEMGESGESANNELSIMLSAIRPVARMTLVPKPIDLDSARFHGLIFTDKNEPEHYKGRKFVSDLGKFFSELPPQDLSYFYDPDVWGISFHASVLNGDPNTEPIAFEYVDGSYCRIVEHVELPVVSAAYGKAGEWRGFQPIVLTLRTTPDTRASIRETGLFKKHRHIELLVPPSVQIALTLLPLFDPKLLTKNANCVCSSAELQAAKPHGDDRSARLIPTISDVLIKVTHAVREPGITPQLYPKGKALNLNAKNQEHLYRGSRELDSKSVFLNGRIDLDAASTKEVRLKASWADIQDNPRLADYSQQPGTSSATPRSVLFDERLPAKPSADVYRELFQAINDESESNPLSATRIGSSTGEFIDQFGLQYSEDKIYLGDTQPETSTNQKIMSNQFNVGDLRRKLAVVEAEAICRYSDAFPEKSAMSLTSPSVQLDFPSSVLMTPPKVNHVSHIRRIFRSVLPNGENRRSSFGIRIYLDRPFFESGFGERLAIACSAGDSSLVEAKELRKDISQWGEDPIERASLQTTLRIPRASDFSCPPIPPSSQPRPLDSVLYKDDGRDGTARVIYRDSIQLPPASADAVSNFVSVASFAVDFDHTSSLWYADVYVEGDFFGWCGLALYRHQPHSVNLRELSSASTWVYSSVLYGEPVVWFEQGGMLQITIGPVFDKSVSFELDPIQFFDGVSEDLKNRDDRFHSLRKYQVGDGWYFEASVPRQHFTWNILKKRFDNPVASFPLK